MQPSYVSQASRFSVWQSGQSGVSVVTLKPGRVKTRRHVDGCSWAVGAVCSGTVTLDSEGMLGWAVGESHTIGWEPPQESDLLSGH